MYSIPVRLFLISVNGLLLNLKHPRSVIFKFNCVLFISALVELGCLGLNTKRVYARAKETRYLSLPLFLARKRWPQECCQSDSWLTLFFIPCLAGSVWLACSRIRQRGFQWMGQNASLYSLYGRGFDVLASCGQIVAREMTLEMVSFFVLLVNSDFFCTIAVLVH